MSSIGLRRSCHTLGATLLREPARKGRTGRPKNSPTHILSGSHVLCKYPNGYADVSSPRASIIAPRPAPVGWQAVEAPDSQNDELPSLRRERTRRPSLIDPDRFEDTVELFHAIVSPRYPQSFFNPQFAKLCDLSLHSLEPGEIRRFLTPRGWIRCTEAVILIYRLLGDPDADFKLCRTLVLPEDHPDPGVPLIIGLPWINEEPLLRQRIKNQTEYHAVDIRSSSSSQTTDLQGDVPADEIGPGARHSTLTGDAPSISTSSPLLAAPRLYEIAIISNKSQASSPNLGPQSDSGSRTSNEPRMWDVSSEDLSDTVSDLASESLDPHSPQEPTPGWSDASETAVENTPVCGEEDSDVEDSEDCMSDLTDDTNASTLDGHGFTTEVFTRLELPFVAWIEGKAMSLAQEKLEEAGLSTHSPMSQHSPGGETNTAGSSPSETAPQNSQRTSAPSPPGRLKLRKRKLDEKDDDDAGKRRGSWKGSADYTADTPIATFACPFHKKYPGNEKLGKACLGPGWESTHRVKEHIFRCHPRLALQCLRCFEVFDDDAMLRNHMRAQPPDQCNVIEEQELMHIRTTPQETELKKRSPRNMPEKEKWVRMYQILFPEVKSHEIPSPYEEVSLSRILQSMGTIEECSEALSVLLEPRLTLRPQSSSSVRVSQGSLSDVIQSALLDTLRDTLPNLVQGATHPSRRDLPPPIQSEDSLNLQVPLAAENTTAPANPGLEMLERQHQNFTAESISFQRPEPPVTAALPPTSSLGTWFLETPHNELWDTLPNPNFNSHTFPTSASDPSFLQWDSSGVLQSHMQLTFDFSEGAMSDPLEPYTFMGGIDETFHPT